MPTFSSVTVRDLAKLDRDQVDLIDVRTPAEFQEVHATMARNVPLESLDAEAVKAARNGSNKSLHVICLSGGRSSQACIQLANAGVTHVVNVEGGTQAWTAAGLPVERGRKMMSLERQVRICAGFLVVLGAGLGLFVHQYFIGLSAFVGAGLMFAGLTNTCGMGMLLARMPWNQRGTNREEGASCPTQN